MIKLLSWLLFDCRLLKIKEEFERANWAATKTSNIFSAQTCGEFLPDVDNAQPTQFAE